MEVILTILGLLNPAIMLATIFGGIVFGILYRNMRLDVRTIYLSIVYVIPFSLGRVIAFGTMSGASGSGVAVTLLFLIYVISTLVTRKLAKRYFPTK